jgi:CubicO group peptidase (beta-lactamase class C family)
VSTFQEIHQLLGKGVDQGVFPGAVLLVARGEEVLFHRAVGYASLIPKKEPLSTATVFDLASLTKPLATTLAVMKSVEEGRLDLDRPPALFKKGGLSNKEPGITVRHLLAHSSGLPAYQPYYALLLHQQGDLKGLIRRFVLQEPLWSPPGTKTLYSDLGFILLEWLVEEALGEDLHSWTQRCLYRPLGLSTLGFRPITPYGAARPEPYAATEDCSWRGKVLRGEVHDDNTYVVGGVSGQAGLFGTAWDIFRLLRELKRAYDRPRYSGLFDGRWVRTFWKRQDRPRGTTRALGFDTPARRGSSAGKFFSSRSVGHLGFTGTSFWYDLEKDFLVVLLTNRVHPSRRNEGIKAFRPLIHDRIVRTVFSSKAAPFSP